MRPVALLNVCFNHLGLLFLLCGRGMNGGTGKDKTNGELLFQCTDAVAAAATS